MDKELAQKMLAEIRGHNIQNWYQAKTGWDKPCKVSCEKCGSEWQPSEQEAHGADCLVAIAGIAVRQMPDPGE